MTTQLWPDSRSTASIIVMFVSALLCRPSNAQPEPDPYRDLCVLCPSGNYQGPHANWRVPMVLPNPVQDPCAAEWFFVDDAATVPPSQWGLVSSTPESGTRSRCFPLFGGVAERPGPVAGTSPDPVIPEACEEPGTYVPLRDQQEWESQNPEDSRDRDVHAARHGPFWSGGIGSYLTPGSSLEATSAALLPHALRSASTSWNGLSRPTLDGKVDLVTGKPLLSITDLEIPFGNAVFRLVRTKADDLQEHNGVGFLNRTAGWDWAGGGWMMSENPILLIDSAYAPVVGNGPRTCFLVLDAHHTIPFQFIESNGLYEAPARFQSKLTHNGIWGATGWSTRPTQFKASLYNGQLHYTFVVLYQDMPRHVVSPQGDYASVFENSSLTSLPPDEIGQQRYASDLHARPLLLDQFPESWQTHDPFEERANPGFGIPYQAICVRIEDNYGHVVDIDYCPVRQFNGDFDEGSFSDSADQYGLTNARNTPCIECVQECAARGQISSITLSVHGHAKWKLLYSFRATLGSRQIWLDHTTPLHALVPHVSSHSDYADFWPQREPWYPNVSGPRVLDQIYVFPVTATNAAALEAAPNCSVFPALHVFGRSEDGISIEDWRSRPGIRDWRNAPHNLNELLPLDALAEQVPWSYRVRYLQSVTLVHRDPGWSTGVDLIGDPECKPLLTSAVTRAAAEKGNRLISTDVVEDRVVLYEKDRFRTRCSFGDPPVELELSQRPDACGQSRGTNVIAIFEPAELASFLRSMSTRDATLANITPDHLALRSEAVAGTEFRELQVNNVSNFDALAASHATAGFAYANASIGDGMRTADGPSWNDIRELGVISADKLYTRLNNAAAPGLGGSVALASLADGTGIKRVFRVFRLAVDPTRTEGSSSLAPSQAMTNDPSAHHPPYRWHAYRDNKFSESNDLTRKPSSVATPDLAQVRWLTVIDEFSTWEEMVSTDSYGGEAHDEFGTKRGQKSRRSVEVNASGVLLRDRLWEFNFDAGTVELTNSGLGEEFIYERAVNVLERNNPHIRIPNPPGPDRNDPNTTPFEMVSQTDHHAAIRDELLLVERRTVGWSVTRNPGQASGLTNGLVYFYHYKPVSYSFDATPNDPDDTENAVVVRPTLAAEGLRQGQYYLPERDAPAAYGEDRSSWLPVGHYKVNTANSDTTIITKAYFRTQLSGEDATSPSALQLCGPSSGISDEWVRDVEVTFTTAIREGDFRNLVNWHAPNGDETLACALVAPPIDVEADADWADLGYTATHWLRKFRPTTDLLVDPLQRPVEQMFVVGPPRKLRPDGQPGEGWLYPVQRDWVDESGKKTWSAEGLLRNPLAPSSSADPEYLQTWNYTRYFFDGRGRPEHVVVDVEPTSGTTVPAIAHDGGPILPNGPGIWSLPAGGIERLPQPAAGSLRWTAPLKYVTSYKYDGDRLSDIFYPNGRRWMSRLVAISRRENCVPQASQPGQPPLPNICAPSETLWWNQPAAAVGSGNTPQTVPYTTLASLSQNQQFTREYIFNEVELRSGMYFSRVIGEVRDYAPNSPPINPIRVRRVFFAEDLGTRFGPQENALPVQDGDVAFSEEVQPRFVTEAAVAGNATPLALDANGRVTSATLLEPDSNGRLLAIGSKEVNELVDMRREREIDGTVTRTTMNTLGFPIRQYVGTEDSSWSGTNNGTSNMVIVSRNAYGESVENAWLPTMTWKYRSQPSWAQQPFQQPSGPEAGAYSQTSYDWRMRPVRVDEYDYPDDSSSLPRRLRTTLTYFDNADRVIATVTFGADLPYIDPLAIPESFDPTGDADAWFVVNNNGLARVQGTQLTPWIELFQIENYAPTSATVNYHGPDNSVVERREYDVSAFAVDPILQELPTGQMQYQAYFSYRGGGGQVVYSQQPGAPVAISVTDGLGRVARTDMRSRGSGASSTWPTYASTKTTFDADGNAVDVRSLERVFGSDPLIELDDLGAMANAVRQRTVSWFDPSKRVDATLVLGTEQTGGYLTGPTSYVRPIDDDTESRPRLSVDGGQLVRHIDAPIKNSGGLLTINRHNIATGRITHVRNPDDTITETLYDAAGRVKSVIENREGTPADQRRTDYEYRFGRLVKILTGTSQTPAASVTEIRYGASVLEYTSDGGVLNYAEMSYHNGLIGSMRRSSMDGPGQPEPDKVDLSFAYTFNGLLARRIDARGVAFQYFYDGLDRLIEIQLGKWEGGGFTQFKLPDTLNVSGQLPSSMIHRITISYNPRGLVERVTAYGLGGSEIVSDVGYTYDARGNLRREKQLHGSELYDLDAAVAPSVEYMWNYAPTDATQNGHTRLFAMRYPVEEHGGVPRFVRFNYDGGHDGVDNRFSRVSRIESFVPGQTNLRATIARYSYAGTSRRVAMSVPVAEGPDADPNVAALSLFTKTELGNATLGGLDRFGRNQFWSVQAFTFGNTHATFAGARYTYDIMGNRLSQNVTQFAVGSAPARSQVHTYDRLNRLVGSTMGTLLYGQGGAASIDPTSVLRTDNWTLDILGNWAGGPTKPGRETTASTVSQSPLAWGVFNTTSGQAPWIPAATHPMSVGIFDVTHAVNQQSEITSVLQELYGSTPASANVVFLHDKAGNLAFDGQYYYSYDAWNRLVQINKASLPQPQPPPAQIGLDTVIIGDLVRHYTYDGLGRMIRAQYPYTPNNGSPVQQSPGLRSERYFYDGIRRIQTIVLDQVYSLEGALALGSGDLLQQLAEEITEGTAEVDIVDEHGVFVSNAELDANTTPISLEAEIVEQSLQAIEIEITPFLVPQLHREYVWGPGDNGVDELVAYFDGEDRDKAHWTIQDAGGDVVAVIRDNGIAIPVPRANGVGSIMVPTARVVAQWTYDAYGEVLSADYFAAHATCDVGHKGLFVDRLDMQQALQAGNYTTDTPPKLVPYAHAIYHNRNRTYAPNLGRFMQSDPNATGMVVLDALAYHGDAISPREHVPVMQTLHGDGANFYQYVRGNPFAWSDPLGLYGLGDLANDAGDTLGLLDPLPGPSDYIRSVLNALVTEYAANLSWDIEWSSDWTTGDDWHSRGDNSWVTLAIGRGLYQAFDVDLPFTDDSINPLDYVATSASKKPRGVKTPSGYAKYSHTVTWQGKTAYKYVNPKGGRQIIKFDRNAILKTVRVTPSNRRQEIADANKEFPAPKGYVWHHHWVSGTLQCVPEKLHGAIGAGHIGRAQFWPAERF